MGKGLFAKLENLAYWLQIKIMSSKRTCEVVDRKRIFFHPDQKRDKILIEYKDKLKKLKIKND